MSQVKVLLVDDEVEFGFALAERLRLRNFDAKAVSQAEDALAIVRSDPPDVVLLDLRMPGMDGVEVLKMIKQMDSDIQVIMVTGLEDTESIEEAMKSGAFECVMKPLDIEELRIIINKAKKKQNSVE